MHHLIIDNLELTFNITEHGVHLFNDKSLHDLMDVNPVEGIEKLAILLKNEFHLTQNRPLKISNKSLAIEIWGHFWFERLYLKIPHLFRILGLSERIEKSMTEFDCAEYPIDNNRFVWDILSIFYKPIRFIGKVLHYK